MALSVVNTDTLTDVACRSGDTQGGCRTVETQPAEGGQWAKYCVHQRDSNKSPLGRSATGLGGSGDAKANSRKQMFPDSPAMIEKLHKNLDRKEYNVCDFYYKTGFFSSIARSSLFEHTTLSVIAFNALWMWIDTDLNGEAVLLDAHPVFQVAEHAFCVYFTGEWLIRYLSFQKKRNCLRDAWFVFDSTLVLMMVAETWVLTLLMLITGGGSNFLGNASTLRLLRLLRLSRMARMAKLLRSMPELLILVKGMMAAMRSVFFTLLLLMILIYVFAIAMRQLTDGSDAGDKYFQTIMRSMHTLWKDGTLMDNTGAVIDALGDQHWSLVIFFYTFVVFAALMVMNMLIGVLCEVVSAVAQTEREEIQINTVRDGIKSIINDSRLDEDGDNKISKKEFKEILLHDRTTVLLDSVGVDVEALFELSDFLFAKDRYGQEHLMTQPDMMKLVLNMRGSKYATVKDIVDLRKQLTNHLDGCLHDLHHGILPPAVPESRTPDPQKSPSSGARRDRSISDTNSMASAEPRQNGASIMSQLPNQLSVQANGSSDLMQKKARLESALAQAKLELDIFSQSIAVDQVNANDDVLRGTQPCGLQSLQAASERATPDRAILQERASVLDFHIIRMLQALKPTQVTSNGTP